MVGGAVRDTLMGLPVQDRDWVVVGSTPGELVALGYLPVGKDFPVFLHPKTKEEYALARTERKTARGYHGFTVHAAPDVTLEQDLARRDLTINSIAACALIDSSTGRFDTEFDLDPANLTDPYGGQRDIAGKVLRHVTVAFREDPVRILRVARFAARFADFSVAPETMQLMQHMVADGEANALVAERVWQELSRGLMQARPSRMFNVLNECGALQKLLPEIQWGNTMYLESHLIVQRGSDSNLIVDLCAHLNAPLPVRFACLVTSSLKQLESDPNLMNQMCERLRVPLDCKELATLVLREQTNIINSVAFGADELVRLLERCDAFRKPQRFSDVLLACKCCARGPLALNESAFPQQQLLTGVLKAAQSVVTRVIAEAAQSQALDGKQIGERIHEARVAAVAQHINTSKQL